MSKFELPQLKGQFFTKQLHYAIHHSTKPALGIKTGPKHNFYFIPPCAQVLHTPWTPVLLTYYPESWRNFDGDGVGKLVRGCSTHAQKMKFHLRLSRVRLQVVYSVNFWRILRLHVVRSDFLPKIEVIRWRLVLLCILFSGGKYYILTVPLIFLFTCKQ